MPLKADEGVGVAGFRVLDLLARLVALLAPDVGPHFIRLHVLDGDVLDRLREQVFAAGADLHQELEDRSLVAAYDALDRANPGAFVSGVCLVLPRSVVSVAPLGTHIKIFFC
jgi:hypothetical protein